MEIEKKVQICVLVEDDCRDDELEIDITEAIKNGGWSVLTAEVIE